MDIECPDHIELIESDLPFWNNIIAEKAKTEWTAHDLEIAAFLAKAMRTMCEEQSELDNEGSVITTAGGNMAQNPRVRIIADLHSRIMKYRQSLCINARGKQGEPRDIIKRRETAKQIEGGIILGDPRMARPTFQ
jgi:Phage terminase, small subunit